MEDYEALKLLSMSFTMGYAQAKIDFGELTPYINMAQAYKMYGRKLVNQWIKLGIITPIYGKSKNSMVRIDRLQIFMCAAASDYG